MHQTRSTTQRYIGSLIFPRVDQIDFTGPFESVFEDSECDLSHDSQETGTITRHPRTDTDPEKTLAELLCGTQKAQEIRLDIQYAPDPPFNSGSVLTAPPEIVSAVRAAYQLLTDARLVIARRIRAKLGIEDAMPGNG
jgi:hypothetical protein